MSPATGEGEQVSGVSLARYAAVSAALAEPHELEAILAIEGLDARAYGKAELAWKERIVTDAAGSRELFRRYEEELAGAQDWLGRRVSPVDEDPAAWVALLGAFKAAEDRNELLRSLSLGPNDMTRLGRVWRRRAREDAALEKKLGELSARPPAALPALTVEPAVLRRSKEAGPAPLPVAPPTATVSHGSFDFGLDRYAALEAALAVAKGDETRVLARFGIASPEARAELARSFHAHLEDNPEAQRDYRTLLSHYQARATKDAGERPPIVEAAFVEPAPVAPMPPVALVAPPLPVAPMGPPVADAGGTQDVAALLAKGPALPFAESTPSAALASALAHEAKLGDDVEAPRDAGGTMDIAAILAKSGAPLPFREPAPAKASAPSAPLLPAVEAKGAPPPPSPPATTGAGATQDVSAILGGPTLPFVAAAPSPVAARAPSSPPKAPDAGGTMDVASLLAKGPALPFAEKPPATAVAPAPARLSVEQYASLTVELEQWPERFVEALARYQLTKADHARVDAELRLLVGRDPEARARFDRTRAAYHAHLTERRASAPASPAVPDLSLAQYASLAVDLSSRPEARAETLARYRLSEAQKAELDARWSLRLGGDPATRASFEQAMAQYRAWLAGQRR